MSRSLLAALLLGLTGTTHARDVTSAVQAGDAALAQFNLAHAINSYRTALQLDPDHYEATWRLSRSPLDKGTLTDDRNAQKPLYVAAEQLARRATQLQPRHPKGHVFLAIAVGILALFEAGKRKVELSHEVKTHATEALLIDPDEDLAHHLLGVWHREMATLNFLLRQFAEVLHGRFPPASLADSETHLRRAAALAPGNIAHHVELGITLHTAGKRADARATLAGALTLAQTWVTDDHYRTIAKRYRPQ